MAAVLAVALTVVHGIVRIGPTTPVCRAGQPCDRPAARVLLTFVRGTARVRTTTGVDGHYRVRLAAGSWTVSTRSGIAVRPATIVVPRAATFRRDLAIDTGIR